MAYRTKQEAVLKAASLIYGILEMQVTERHLRVASRFLKLRDAGHDVKMSLSLLKISLKEPIVGKTVTPKYRVVVDGKLTMAWDIKEYGRPTDRNAERYAMAYAASLEKGGANAHLSDSRGFVPYPKSVAIEFNHRGGGVVAEWKAAAFQVYSHMEEAFS